MKFTLNREQLLPPLQRVAGAVEKRQTMPILSNVLFSVRPDSLTLLASDMEIELRVEVKLPQVATPGDFTVSARKFIDLCRALPEQAEMVMHQEGERLTVISGKSRFVLSTLPAEDFPKTKEDKAEVEFTLSAGLLKHLLKNTSFAMAQQDVRYYLNGVLFEINPEGIKTVATDGHRLALSSFQGDIACSPYKAIIPRKGVSELMHLLGEASDSVSIQLNENTIRVTGDDFTFISKLIDGKYPEYTKVIPNHLDKTLSIDRDPLKKALQRVSVLSNEQMRGVRLMLSSNLLKIFANNPEMDQAEEELECEFSGEDIEIAFNVAYLIDALNHVPEDKVHLGLGSTQTSIVIETSLELQSLRALYVIMPMHL